MLQAKLDRAMSKNGDALQEAARGEARAEAAERRAEEFAKYAPQQQAPEVPEPPDPMPMTTISKWAVPRQHRAARAVGGAGARQTGTAATTTGTGRAARAGTAQQDGSQYAARSAKLGIKQTELQRPPSRSRTMASICGLRSGCEGLRPGNYAVPVQNPQVLADLHAMPYEDAVVTLATTVKEAAKAARQARTHRPIRSAATGYRLA